MNDKAKPLNFMITKVNSSYNKGDVAIALEILKIIRNNLMQNIPVIQQEAN